MRNTPFTKVFTTRTWTEAEQVVSRLRSAGLHPAELSLTTPLTPTGAEPSYPIEVPAGEEDRARELVKSYDPTNN